VRSFFFSKTLNFGLVRYNIKMTPNFDATLRKHGDYNPKATQSKIKLIYWSILDIAVITSFLSTEKDNRNIHEREKISVNGKLSMELCMTG